MGIEVGAGRHYLMRNGEVAYIDRETQNYAVCPMLGYGITGYKLSWTSDGQFNGFSVSSYDLLEELADDDIRVLEFRALSALEGYPYEN